MQIPEQLSAELEGQYNVRAARPDFADVVIPGWARRSAAFRASSRGELDVAYGTDPRERLDFFSSGSPNGAVLVFFHGGYWQRFDKSLFSFIAQSFVMQGVSVAVVDYSLCPGVRLSEIPAQGRRALAWIWRNAKQLGISAEKLYVMGHSAGGHITAMMMATDWAVVGKDLPRDLIKGGIPISGLFDLRPLLRTSINVGLQMDDEEATRMSPLNNPLATNAPQLVACGGRESAEFHRQSDAYVAAFRTEERRMDRYNIPDCDHMDVLDALCNADSTLFRKAIGLIDN